MSLVASRTVNASSQTGISGHANNSAIRKINYSSSPLLASKTPAWRSKFLVLLLGLSFCILLGQAANIQIIDSAFFQKQGEKRYSRTLELKASRGRITDRNGVLLATSVPAPSIWVIPKEFDATLMQRQRLAKLLELSLSELNSRLKDNSNFVWLRRGVDLATAQKIEDLKLKGIHQMSEYQRHYPEGEPVSHIVGFTNLEDKGQEGIELAFDKSLSGENGQRRVIKDRLGRVVEDVGDTIPALEGQNIALSIDSKIQFFAYQQLKQAVHEHKAKAGSVVVLDSHSGEVLALVNYPGFSATNRKNLSGEMLRNRALTDTFEPGSTMKPFIVALALEERLIRPNTLISTSPGRLILGGAAINDAHPHGDLTVEQVIQKSSNVGTVKIAMQLQPSMMHEMFTEIGLGQKPQLNFPGVVSGRLRHYKSWRPIEQATMSYGYGLSASLLQLARAYTVFASDGRLLPVTLVKSKEPVQGMRVFSPQTASNIRQMLQMATNEGGTGPRAQTLGFSVGGKTGTARKHEGKGYAEKKYRSWFVGLAPIHNPKIVVAVMLDEPSNGKFYGGDVAAPVFSEVVQQTLRTLHVTPDLDIERDISINEASPVLESF